MTDDQTTANTRPKPDDGDGSYVHQFDETYSALDDLLDEINDVEDQIDASGTIARELAKAKKAVASAADFRMRLLEHGAGGES